MEIGKFIGRIKEVVANPSQFFPDEELKFRLISETENAQRVLEERERLRQHFNRALEAIVTVPGTHVIKEYLPPEWVFKGSDESYDNERE